MEGVSMRFKVAKKAGFKQRPILSLKGANLGYCRAVVTLVLRANRAD